jgi:hypothetical protein
MTEQQSSSTITTIDKRSWFQRLGSSFRGVLTGLVLFIIAFPILILNEGRAIDTYRSLQEGASVFESTDPEVIDPSQDGKLIYFSGEARTPDTLSDDLFGISENALKLKRIVELYQWTEGTQTETVEKFGGGTETTTTYSYQQVWDDDLIDSSSFQDRANHNNPESKPLENQEQVASQVSVGAYTLPNRLVNSISDYQRLDLNSDLLTALPYSQQEQWQVFNNYIYQSDNPSNPQIGDVRVWYQVLRPDLVSVIAKQKGSSLEPYTTKNDKSIEMIRLGQVSAEEMFEGATQSNRLLTWMVRILGFFFIYIGLNTLLVPLSTFLSIIPFLAKIFRFASKLLVAIISLVISLTVIALAWIFYRPVLAAALLLIAVGIIVIYGKFKNKNKMGNLKNQNKVEKK